MEPSTATEKVLGVVWDPIKDNFHFKVKLSFSPEKNTTRTHMDANPTDVQPICSVENPSLHPPLFPSSTIQISVSLSGNN